MIYDCFPFFNELDMLEVRLHELKDVVDFFVLSEATVTHQNNPKLLYYKENKERFKEFHHKIIHNVITDASSVYKGNPWNIDHYMHDHCHKVIPMQPDDLVIIGDADQIVRADTLAEIKEVWERAGLGRWQMSMIYSYYFFNCIHTEMTWDSSFILPKKDLKVPAHVVRYHPDRSGLTFQKATEGGWHFSYMGGIEKIREKIKAFSDVSVNRGEFLDEEHLIRAIQNAADLYNRSNEGPMAFVPLDARFPKYVRLNKGKFSKHIKEIV